MKKFRIVSLLLVVGAIAASTWFVASNDLIGKFFNESQPDLPKRTKAAMGMENYLIARNEHLDMLRGFDTALPESRIKSIRDMERSEAALAESYRGANRGPDPSWRAIGPAPIPVSSVTSYSGRVSAIAVHPTNPDIVYAGAAQGGLYRTLDGGATWEPIMDTAASIAIGAVAISPSDPTTIYVGTGESTLCGSGCYIGVGVYRITNADTHPVLTGPLNKNSSGTDVFSGRAISEVLIHPTDPNTIFVSTTTGIAGIGATTSGFPNLPALGVYRSTNAMSDEPVFNKLSFGATFTDRSVTDIVMEPGNPEHIYAGLIGVGAGDGGVYYAANALDEAPTFTQLLSTALTGNQSRVELAAAKVEGVTTVYAASGDGTGTVHKSVDAAPFTLTVDNNFCNPQCFYDIAIAVDPTDANRVYLGGSPTLVFGRSTNGGTSFANSSSRLHVDTQVFAVAPSNPSIFYFGSDGGIWRTNDVKVTGGVVWNTLNNTTFSATQFMGLALHPTDINYTLGGTQDNGTQFLAPDGQEWIRSDGGDGGFAFVDQSATDTTNVTSYHTYFNQSGSQIGYARATTTVPPGDPVWAGDIFGCGGVPNGINCSDAVLFYAPMVGGPAAADSNGASTLYFGTNRLYRSADKGVTMVDVSGSVGSANNPRVTAIAIAPQNDNIRLMGTTLGRVYLSTTEGATTMNTVTGSIPARYIGRIAIDPVDANIAYVALNGFGLPNGHHIWKTTNLLTGTPTWVASGMGIPDTPVSSFAIDPENPQHLYAGSDIGVFRSTDGGANWIPFSNGLPRVAVFGMAIHPQHRVLRIATHGRGMYDMTLDAPAANNAIVSDFDGDGKSDLAVFRPGDGNWYYHTSSNDTFNASGWGVNSDILTPGDYDGDGKTDFAVYRPAEGTWYINGSQDGFSATSFGVATDLPVAADYDNNGKTDIAVFRPSTGNWYIKQGDNFAALQFGVNGDRPAPGDYDGDGAADIAVFRGSTGVWYINGSTAGFSATQFGVDSDKIVPGDYDGDGKTDIAVFRPSNGFWYSLGSAGEISIKEWGLGNDIPSPGDYDGDGTADLSVFRPSLGMWFRLNSGNGQFFAAQFGTQGDEPIPAAYVPVQ